MTRHSWSAGLDQRTIVIAFVLRVIVALGKMGYDTPVVLRKAPPFREPWEVSGKHYSRLSQMAPLVVHNMLWSGKQQGLGEY